MNDIVSTGKQPAKTDPNRMEIIVENQEICSHSEKEQSVTPYIKVCNFLTGHGWNTIRKSSRPAKENSPILLHKMKG